MVNATRALVGRPITINERAGEREAHVFGADDADAIEAALLSERPLLIAGEPGVGKTQFAAAAAAAFQRPCRAITVNASTEARDLLWRDDPVDRLAQAQLVGALGSEEARAEREKLDRRRFVQPGVLWWGFSWAKASDHVREFRDGSQPELGCGADPANGVVVLIDEIDKAESELPNGLLEALGSRAFDGPEGCGRIEAETMPLVVVTTNRDRPLPPAFLRRCVFHEIRLPDDPDELQTRLVEIARAHFPDAEQDVLFEAACLTAEDRRKALRLDLEPRPGPAECVDLLRAALSPRRSNDVPPFDALQRLSPFFLRKHPELR